MHKVKRKSTVVHVGTGHERLPGVAPRASVYSPTSDGLGQVWNRPARALKDNTIAADKGEGSSRSHVGMSAWGLGRSLTDRA